MTIIQRYVFLFLNENISFDHLLAPSRRDGSNEGSQNMFYGEIWKIIPKLSLLPLLIWSAGCINIMKESVIYFIFFISYTNNIANQNKNITINSASCRQYI